MCHSATPNVKLRLFGTPERWHDGGMPWNEPSPAPEAAPTEPAPSGAPEGFEPLDLSAPDAPVRLLAELVTLARITAHNSAMLVELGQQQLAELKFSTDARMGWICPSCDQSLRGVSPEATSCPHCGKPLEPAGFGDEEDDEDDE